MKIYPDCGYFNEEQNDEFAPIGECETCYRYEICKRAYENGISSIPIGKSINHCDDITKCANSELEDMTRMIICGDDTLRCSLEDFSEYIPDKDYTFQVPPPTKFGPSLPDK